MLRVGLTGGIGSGKSTVAHRFAELGAVVIDADRLAREVVAAGSTGLAAIRERFGDGVVGADGSLDRGALGQVVFADVQARRDLEALTHPLIAGRTRTIVNAATRDQIVVHDVPLLVELDLAADYHLTVVVGADEDIRVARLTADRGFTAREARARIAAQASDSARREAADVWLDNSGTVEALLAQVEALWEDRLVGFNDNLLTGTRSPRPETATLVPYDETWPSVASRLIARITSSLTGAGLGGWGLDVEHIGSTSVPGLTAKEVIDLQVGVTRLADADAPEFVKVLAERGFPRCEGNDHDTVHGWAPQPASWAKRFHGSSDPGRVAHVHVREHGSAGWEAALLFRDWLVAERAERDEYAALKMSLAPAPTDAGAPMMSADSYTLAKEPWIDSALERARVWARHTGWRPS